MNTNTRAMLSVIRFKALLAVLLLSGFCSLAQATTTYQQNAISGGIGIFANSSAGAITADNFTLASQITLQSLTWWGSYDVKDTDSFIIKVYGSTGGVPGSLLATYNAISVSGTLSGFNDSNASPIYRYDYSLPDNFVLPAGSYFLVITNETSQHRWFWSAGNGGDSLQKALSANGRTWVAGSNSDLAFTVNSISATQTSTSVPIPQAFIYLMMGGLVYLGRGLQKRQSQG